MRCFPSSGVPDHFYSPLWKRTNLSLPPLPVLVPVTDRQRDRQKVLLLTPLDPFRCLPVHCRFANHIMPSSLGVNLATDALTLDVAPVVGMRRCLASRTSYSCPRD